MNYVLIVGPPAVGKATVAREVARLTGYRLVLNTLTSEMLLDIFARPERPFGPLHVEFQHRILEEAARHGMDVVSTLAWAFDEPTDWRVARARFALVRQHGGKSFIAELEAPLPVRLDRNNLPDRRTSKPNQAATLTAEVMQDLDARYRLNSDPGELDEFGPHLRIDTTSSSPTESARRVIDTFGLPLLP
jgi:hypothetical protein